MPPPSEAGECSPTALRQEEIEELKAQVQANLEQNAKITALLEKYTRRQQALDNVQRRSAQRRRSPPKTRKRCAPIPPDTRQQIRQDFNDGIPAVELAKRYGCSTVTVYNIAKEAPRAGGTPAPKRHRPGPTLCLMMKKRRC